MVVQTITEMAQVPETWVQIYPEETATRQEIVGEGIILWGVETITAGHLETLGAHQQIGIHPQGIPTKPETLTVWMDQEISLHLPESPMVLEVEAMMMAHHPEDLMTMAGHQ